MKARVLKRNTKTVIVSLNGTDTECSLRGKLKQNSADILVGDFVDVNETTLSVEEVLPRTNRLIRPLVANVNQVFIVVSEKPVADLFLVDQMIMNADALGIGVFLVVNKEDQNSKEFEQQIVLDYNKVVSGIIFTSAKTGEGTKELEKLMQNKMSVLVGQSGVGKSSLINCLTNSTKQQTSELSQKISRGINTTRYNKVFEVAGGLLIDSPGFSAISLGTIDPMELCRAYTEFLPHASECEYSTCDHIHGQNCGVKRAMESGTISPNRYKRYTILFEKYTKLWQNRYRRNKQEKNTHENFAINNRNRLSKRRNAK